MQIAPNGAVLEGVVKKISREVGGLGCELEFDVRSVKPVKGKRDFLRAAIGDKVTLYLASDDPIRVGGKYRFDTTVLGGPGGERTVVQSVADLAKLTR